MLTPAIEAADAVLDIDSARPPASEADSMSTAVNLSTISIASEALFL